MIMKRYYEIALMQHVHGSVEDDYETVKKMKVSKTSYTVNDLEPDSFYYFEIIGCVKTDGKLKGVIYDYLYCYTGISSVGWNDYASSDAPCSPENITLWFYNYEDGLPAEGFEIYRREDDSEDWTLLATPDISTTEYDDKNIEAGNVVIPRNADGNFCFGRF